MSDITFENDGRLTTPNNRDIHRTLDAVTQRIIERSRVARADYLKRMEYARRAHGREALSASNLAHVLAASTDEDRKRILQQHAHIGIVTAYNDMLSAHEPFVRFPDVIKHAARTMNASAQVASGVPAMCDGVTQGQLGMEFSLFSRDVIALSAAVGLSHNVFDAVVMLGTCDKIVPGLLMAAASFGHVPTIFLPAGPMPSGLENAKKAEIREHYAAGVVGREALLEAEMASYHTVGTCTFYGTANGNQMLLEIMGMQLPASSFVAPNSPMRDPLTAAGVRAVLDMTRRNKPVATKDILTEKAFVNGIVGLLATGGSTNLVIHLIAIARIAGIALTTEDFSELSHVVPLLARVYPNGLADVNQFHAAGGLSFVVAELLEHGLLHDDVQTVAGEGLRHYTQEIAYTDNSIKWRAGTRTSHAQDILRSVKTPFQMSGGLMRLTGVIGEAVIKVSALKQDYLVIEAPARVFLSQEALKQAFDAGELDGDFICVLPFQGPKAKGMPELHGLMSTLGACQTRGQKVALVTDGRLSGASGKVPAAIHVSPEAAAGGAIALVRDGDMVRIDVHAGTLDVLVDDLHSRTPITAPDASPQIIGQELFALFRNSVGSALDGASVFGEIHKRS